MNLLVDLGALAHNLTAIKKRSQSCVVFMVKADAYGHGVQEVAQHTKNLVKAFGVATLAEGLALSHIGIDTIVFQPNIVSTQGILRGLVFSVDDPAALQKINEIADRHNTLARVHIAIDSGMGRFGLDSLAALFYFCKVAKGLKNILIEGVYTHFSSAKANKCEAQFAKFCFLKTYAQKFFGKLFCHIGGSAVLRFGTRYVADGVRIGLLAYGFGQGMRPAMKFLANVIAVKKVKRGCAVGYDGDFCPTKDCLIAVCEGGYADGIPRTAKGFLLCKNQNQDAKTEYLQMQISQKRRLCNNSKKQDCGEIVGKVCMDCHFLRFDSLNLITTGDVYAINDMSKFAQHLGVSPYEVVTRWGGRVNIDYINKPQ